MNEYDIYLLAIGAGVGLAIYIIRRKGGDA
jgi:hypothetical protein